MIYEIKYFTLDISIILYELFTTKLIKQSILIKLNNFIKYEVQKSVLTLYFYFKLTLKKQYKQ